MTVDLSLAASDATAIRSRLTDKDVEGCAILFANMARYANGAIHLLVREVEFPITRDYSQRDRLAAELRPEFVARVTKRAKREGMSLVFVHSHPGDEAPMFSETDAEGEQHLSAFLDRRHPSEGHAAMVVSDGGFRARRLGTNEDVRVLSIGTRREVLFDPSESFRAVDHAFDRQVRVFGSSAQVTLGGLRVAIVGLGGTGSLVAQQLVHLGVRQFVLIDPDVIEITNLNRVANAGVSDLGHRKVDVASRYIKSVAPDAAVESVEGDVIRVRFAKGLASADIIFGCTDSHGSRAVLQQVAYQYLVPCIDMGTTIAVRDGRVTHVYGRIQLLAPGLACLTCGGLLDPEQVRRDMMTAFERQQDPYLQGAHEPAPAVMSLNGTVTSVAVTMLLAIFAGIPSPARHILYNAIASTLRSVQAKPDPACVVCSRSGALARGDSWPLFARAD